LVPKGGLEPPCPQGTPDFEYYTILNPYHSQSANMTRISNSVNGLCSIDNFRLFTTKTHYFHTGGHKMDIKKDRKKKVSKTDIATITQRPRLGIGGVFVLPFINKGLLLLIVHDLKW
jgi:hypothetical protein